MIVNHFRLSIGVVLLLLAACAQQAPPSVVQHTTTKPTQTQAVKLNTTAGVCSDSSRQQTCPDTFEPVCATRDTGVRCITTPCPSTQSVSYDNACKACADDRVRSWRSGACLP